jgi:hypothetical protein
MNENVFVKHRYCCKCGKMLHVGIGGDTCLTCLCGLEKRNIANREEKQDE